MSYEPSSRFRLASNLPQQPDELRESSELPYLITNTGLQISFLAKEIGWVQGGTVFRVALNCYDESKTHPCASTIYLVKDVMGVQAQRAEPYCVGSKSNKSGWDGWRTSQFLINPIWLPPLSTNLIRNQMDIIELEHLTSKAIRRMEEAENQRIREKNRKRRSNMWISGALIICCWSYLQMEKTARRERSW